MERETVARYRKELNAILKEYGELVGLQFNLGNIKYSSTDFSCTLKGITASSPEEADQLNWNSNCRLVGFTSEDYGKEFKARGSSYKLVGIRPKARKYPIVAKKESDGKSYIFSASFIKSKELS